MSQKNILKACYNARGLHDAFRAMQGGMEKLNPTFFSIQIFYGILVILKIIAIIKRIN